jgi:ribonuclease D
MRTLWIDQPDQLRDFCASIDSDVIAVDTESDHFHAYQAQVCLIQVGTPEVGALVDPLALEAEDLAPLFELLRDPKVTTLLHSARNDIRELDRDYGVGIANVFDTQIAAKFLGYEKNGLSWLQEEIVGDTPSGNYQRFDWTTRPIHDKAREYAILDVADLFPLRERFLPELEESPWLEPFRQQCAYIATISGYEPSPFDPEDWRRAARGKNLDGPTRAAMRELFIARHEICAKENRAALHIFSNGALVELARAKPRTAAEVQKVRRLSDEIGSQYAELLLEAVERAETADHPPEKRPREHRERPPLEERQIFNALKSWRNRTSDSLDISGEFIATNATLSEIAAYPPATVEGLDAFVAILPWHREMFGEEILETIENATP